MEKDMQLIVLKIHKKNSYVAIQDADLEYVLSAHKLYDCFIKNKKIKVIYGSRFLKDFLNLYIIWKEYNKNFLEINY